jgi:hypothetical protein
MGLDDEIITKIAEERMALDWRGKTSWEGDTRPAEHVERCKEYARWYISRWQKARLESLPGGGIKQAERALLLAARWFRVTADGTPAPTPAEREDMLLMCEEMKKARAALLAADAVEETQQPVGCPTCQGQGWYADRDPKNPEGEPIQVQCSDCGGIPTNPEFEKWYGENVSPCFAGEHQGIYHSAHAVFGRDVRAAWEAAMATKRELNHRSSTPLDEERAVATMANAMVGDAKEHGGTTSWDSARAAFRALQQIATIIGKENP